MDDLKMLFGRLEGLVTARFDEQSRRLDEITEQTKKTNGRVTALEMDNAARAAAKQAVADGAEQRSATFKWWVGTLIAFAGCAAGAAATVAVFIT